MALDVILSCIGAWLALGIVGLVCLHRMRIIARMLFPLGSACALVLALCALEGLFGPSESRVLPIGLPGLPFQIHLDALSAFFLFLLGTVASGVSIFAAGYFRHGEGTPPGLLCLQYHIFLAAMALVVLAADAYTFMVTWETMALASYFLVTTNDRLSEVRRAGYLYLLIAHIGAIAILLCFGVLQADSGDYTFAGMRAQSLRGSWPSIAFLLALLGFGAKAGLVPLHLWLPEAHPAAPSPVSALMSAVMLKTAVYGLLRVTLDLLETPAWWWGALLLALGLASALLGVVFAAVQVEMKRLLAFSSIENIGIMFAGIGLAILFASYELASFAALTLCAVLYHCLSHGWFKSLLFVATGSVLHATGERNLGRLGGLMRYMPHVAWMTLIGVLAAAGLPPFGGFIAEWLLLQSFLFTPELPAAFLTMLLPIAAALVVLVAALAAYTMVKFFGVIFLGRPRELALANAHDASLWERCGMLWLASGTIALGVLPREVLLLIEPVTQALVGGGIGAAIEDARWLVVPIAQQRASYGPLVFIGGVAASFAVAWAIVRAFYHGRLRRAPAWDCGYPFQTARMQDTAEGFGQPIRQIFEPLFRMQRELPSPFDHAPRYRVTVDDHLWHVAYVPLATAVEWLARQIGRIQQGRIAHYLIYSFGTLLVMLLFAVRAP